MGAWNPEIGCGGTPAPAGAPCTRCINLGTPAREFLPNLTVSSHHGRQQ